MKVAREARHAVEEWQVQAAEIAAEESAQDEEIARVGMETLDREYAIETQQIADEINRQSLAENWDPDQWRQAMLDTYRFSEDELADEYASRLAEHRDYGIAMFELYEPYD